MPKKLYDALTVCKIVLGIVIPLFVGLNEIWNIPFGYQIIQTLTVVEGALIAALKIDSTKYFEDKLIIKK